MLGAVFLVGIVFSHRFIDPYESPKEVYLVIVVLAMIFLAAAGSLKRLLAIQFSITTIDLFGFLFVLYLLFRALLSGSFQPLDTSVILLFAYCALYLFLRRQKELSRFIIFALSIVVLWLVSLGTYQYFNWSGGEGAFRISGSSGNPGPYAIYLATLLPLFLGIGLSPIRKRKIVHYLSFAAIVVITFILVIASSRTSWIVGSFAVAAFLFYLLRKALHRWTLVLLCISALGFGGYFLYNLKSDSANGRFFIWQTTISMIVDAPAFGHGYHTFSKVQKDYQADYFLAHPSDHNHAMLADNSHYAFNEVLHLIAEFGFTGLLLVLLFILVSFRGTGRSTISDEDRYQIFIGKVGVAGILLGAQFFYSLHSLPVVCLLVLYLSIIANQRQPIFTLRFPRSIVLPASAITLVSVFLLFNLQIQRFRAELDWKLAYSDIRSTKNVGVLEEYTRLYPKMKHNPQFLFNYGTELSVHHQYQDSYHILNEASDLIGHSDLYLYQGINLEAMDSISSARSYFEKASLIVPSRIYPKYRLFVLLHNSRAYDKAEIIAREILDMEVKIENHVSKIVKLEMREYLQKQNKLNG